MKTNVPKEVSSGHHVYVTDVYVELLTDWELTLSKNSSAVVRHVRSQKMQSPSALFDEFSAALQFPFYFGENWDAFEECIADLEWLNGYCFIVVITEVQRLMRGVSYFRSLLELLTDTSVEHDQNNRRFLTVLQCDSSFVGELKELLNELSIDFGDFEL